MKFTIITLFPEIFQSVFSSSILNRAQKNEQIEISYCNLREFGIGQHKSVDDKPYGGGTGMVIRYDVLTNALKSVRQGGKESSVLLEPIGTPFSQEKAENFSRLQHLILICGRYEGFDARIRDDVDEIISLGNFVLSGGEIPAMAVVEATARLVEGVVPKEEATEVESFTKKDGQRILEFPQYTRPEEYNGKKVPNILLSGDHKKIDAYRKKEAIKLTKKLRPDILTDK